MIVMRFFCLSLFSLVALVASSAEAQLWPHTIYTPTFTCVNGKPTTITASAKWVKNHIPGINPQHGECRLIGYQAHELEYVHTDPVTGQEEIRTRIQWVQIGFTAWGGAASNTKSFTANLPTPWQGARVKLEIQNRRRSSNGTWSLPETLMNSKKEFILRCNPDPTGGGSTPVVTPVTTSPPTPGD